MLDNEYVNVGKVSGAFGIKGWLKIFSFTDPRENILAYSPWVLRKGNQSKVVNVLDGNIQGRSIVAQVSGVIDRDMAIGLSNWDIFINPEQLPEPEEGEYYWSELLGLTVETTQGEVLGVVDNLLETGANDVIIVSGERERAIPFLQGQTIVKVDLEAAKIIVDWDPDF